MKLLISPDDWPDDWWTQDLSIPRDPPEESEHTFASFAATMRKAAERAFGFSFDFANRYLDNTHKPDPTERRYPTSEAPWARTRKSKRRKA